MQQQDIERIVRGLLADLGVNVTLLLVEPATAAWRVVLKTEGGPMEIVLPDGPAVAVRARLQHYIESNIP